MFLLLSFHIMFFFGLWETSMAHVTLGSFRRICRIEVPIHTVMNSVISRNKLLKVGKLITFSV